MEKSKRFTLDVFSTEKQPSGGNLNKFLKFAEKIPF